MVVVVVTLSGFTTQSSGSCRYALCALRALRALLCLVAVLCFRLLVLWWLNLWFFFVLWCGGFLCKRNLVWFECLFLAAAFWALSLEL